MSSKLKDAKTGLKKTNTKDRKRRNLTYVNKYEIN